MLLDLNISESRSCHPKIPDVSPQDRTSEFRTVKWSRPRQLHQPFPTNNFYQALRNIVSTNGWYAHFGGNLILSDWSFERIKYASSKIFHSERRIKHYELISSHEYSGVRHSA
jgi:hypothetical protein